MDNYNLPLGVDIGDLLKDLKSVNDGLGKATDKAKETGDALTAAMGKGAEAAGRAEVAISEATKQISNTTTAANKATTALGATAVSATQVGSAVVSATDQKPISNFVAAAGKIKGIFDAAGGSLKGFTIAQKDSRSETEKLQGQLNQLKQAYQDGLGGKVSTQQLKDYAKQIHDVTLQLEAAKKAATAAGSAASHSPVLPPVTPGGGSPPASPPSGGGGLAEANEQGGFLSGILDKIGIKTQSVGGLLRGAAAAAIAFFAVDKAVDFLKEVVSVTAEFQKLQATLDTALGGHSAGAEAFDRIQKFAAATPYQVDEITGAFVKLANRGFVPTNEELTKMGDLAASQGKSFDQLTEAILDAQTGEFERLKEFGIKASAQGDKVQISFKGVKETVTNSASAIRGAIIQLGALDGVKGNMEAVSKTIGGAISNLEDATKGFLYSIGKLIAPFVIAILTGLTTLINGISSLISTKEDLVAVGFKNAVQSKNEAEQAQKLLDRYKELQSKGVKATADEKKEMTRITYLLKDALGDSVTAIDKETNALKLNTEATQDAIRKKVLLANNDLAKLALAYTANKAQIAIMQSQKDDLEKALGVKRDETGSVNGQVSTNQASKVDQPRGFSAQDTTEQSVAAGKLAANLGSLNAKLTEYQKVNGHIVSEAAKNGLKATDLDLYAANAPKAAGDDPTTQTAAQIAKAQALAKAKAELQLKLLKELQDATVAAMEDGADKERAIAKKNADEQLAALELDKKNAEVAKTWTEEDGVIYGKLKQQIGDNLIAIDKQIAEREANAKIALELEARKQINSLQADSLQKELEAIEIDFSTQELAIKEKYKKRKDLEVLQLLALAVAKKQAVDKTTGDYETKQLNDSEQATLNIIELYNNKKKIEIAGYNDFEKEEAKEAGVDLVTLEKNKQLQILAVKLFFAKQKEETAIKGGNADEIKAATQAVVDAQVAMNNAVHELKGSVDLGGLISFKNIGGGNFADLFKSAFDFKGKAGGKSLGELIGLSPEDQQIIEESFGDAFNAIGQLYENMIDGQIAAKDKEISALDDQISQAEDLYNKELDLQKQGYANNADGQKKMLDELKKQRDKDQKDKEALQKKNKIIAEAEIATQTAVTVAQLIAATVQAIQATAGIPFVGVALGLAAAAALVTGFLAVKAKANEAIGDTNKKKQGGRLEGASHERQGVRYRAVDGSQTNLLELEGGEFVTKKHQTDQHLTALEAINNNDFTRMTPNDVTFRKMLQGMGIHTLDDDRRDVMQKHNTVKERAFVLQYNNNSGNSETHLQTIAEHTAVLAEAEATRETTWMEGTTRVTRRGNVTTRIETAKR